MSVATGCGVCGTSVATVCVMCYQKQTAEVERLRAALVALKDYIAGQMTFTNDGAGWQPDDLPLAQLMTAAEEAILGNGKPD